MFQCRRISFAWRDGTTTRMEELAYQRWEGECIGEETFFYDPAASVRSKGTDQDKVLRK